MTEIEKQQDVEKIAMPRDFNLFWFGEAVSLFGIQVTMLALPLTAVLVFAAGPEQVGLLRGLELAPFLFLAMPFGVWADRVRRRPLMIAANGVRAVAIGLVPLLHAFGRLNLAALFAVALVAGVASVLYDVCWMSYVPSLLTGRAQLMTANSRVGATNSAADIGGPGLAGLLIQVLSAPVALVVNAGSFLVSMLTLIVIRTPEPAPPVSTTGRNLLREIGEGLRWVFGNPILRTITLLGGAYNFFFTFIQTVFLVYAVRVLHFNPGLIGAVVSLGGVGGLLGAAAAGNLTRRFPIGRIYLVAALVAFAAPIAVPLAGGPRLITATLLALAFFVGYSGIGVVNVLGVSFRQTITPNRLMGRMNAAVRTLLYGSGALGAPLGGALAELIGLRTALAVAAAGSMVAFLPLLVSPIRGLRELPEPIAAEA